MSNTNCFLLSVVFVFGGRQEEEREGYSWIPVLVLSGELLFFFLKCFHWHNMLWSIVLWSVTSACISHTALLYMPSLMYYCTVTAETSYITESSNCLQIKISQNNFFIPRYTACINMLLILKCNTTSMQFS